MNVKLKTISGSGKEFEEEVAAFISSVKVVRTNYTSHNMHTAFIEYEEKGNGTESGKSKISSRFNKRNKG